MKDKYKDYFQIFILHFPYSKDIFRMFRRLTKWFYQSFASETPKLKHFSQSGNISNQKENLLNQNSA